MGAKNEASKRNSYRRFKTKYQREFKMFERATFVDTSNVDPELVKYIKKQFYTSIDKFRSAYLVDNFDKEDIIWIMIDVWNKTSTANSVNDMQGYFNVTDEQLITLIWEFGENI